MKTFAFEAKCVVSQHPDGEFHLVGFADEEFETSIHLILQRAFEYDEQDIENGMDSYHVEWCEQGNSGYGGISRFVLERANAYVTFEPHVSAELDGLERLAISFQISNDEYLQLKAALAEVFAGTECFVAAGA